MAACQHTVLGLQMDAEKAFVDWAAGEGRIVVHPTICYGVRECGGSSTFDQSCHWGTDGLYMCLRFAQPRSFKLSVSRPAFSSASALNPDGLLGKSALPAVRLNHRCHGLLVLLVARIQGVF